MEGKTHRLGGTAFMLATFEYMRLNGLTIEGVNPLIQLAIMYPAASFGSVMPDVDHHKGSNPIKTPAGELFHRILHLPSDINKKVNRSRNGKPRNKFIDDLISLKHRSWQTHSLVLTGGGTFALLSIVNYYTRLNPTFDMLIIHMLVAGFAVGLFSHLILDMLTTSGVWLVVSKKIKVVPSSSAFATGSYWEKVIVTNCLIVISLFLTCSICLSIAGVELIPITTELLSEVAAQITYRMSPT